MNAPYQWGHFSAQARSIDPTAAERCDSEKKVLDFAYKTRRSVLWTYIRGRMGKAAPKTAKMVPIYSHFSRHFFSSVVVVRPKLSEPPPHNRIEADVHDSNAPELPLMVLLLLGLSTGKMPLI